MFFSSFDCAKDVNPFKTKTVKRIVFFIGFIAFWVVAQRNKIL